MAPTQRTGTAKGARINDGHPPTRRTTPEGRYRGGRAGPNDDQIVVSLLVCHTIHTSLQGGCVSLSRAPLHSNVSCASLVAVTLGNLVGGTVRVAAVYWCA